MSFAELSDDGSAAWPLDHVLAVAANQSDGRERCVLLTTGAMSPVHHGHIKMLEVARTALEAKNFAVLGGFLSPSHDLYVGPKAAKLGTVHVSAAHRVGIAAAALDGHSWIRVATWEARQRGRWPDFPEVAAECAQMLARHIGPHRLFYVCGFDHYHKCGLAGGMGGGLGVVVVPRAGGEPGEEDPGVGVYCAMAAEDVQDVSSTKIRAALLANDAVSTATAQRMLGAPALAYIRKHALFSHGSAAAQAPQPPATQLPPSSPPSSPPALPTPAAAAPPTAAALPPAAADGRKPRDARPRRGLHTLFSSSSHTQSHQAQNRQVHGSATPAAAAVTVGGGHLTTAAPTPSEQIELGMASPKAPPMTEAEAATVAEVAEPVEVRAITGKGLGGFARRPISRGECIVSELPLLQWTLVAGEEVTRKGAARQVASLPAAEQAAFWALHQNEEHGAAKTAYGIWISNAFPTDSAADGANSMARSRAAVFRLYCRLNHACVPNVHGCWNARRGVQTMYALRSIVAGEELTVDYLGACGAERAARQSSLANDMGFRCACELCALADGSDALLASERRQARIGELHGEIDARLAEVAAAPSTGAPSTSTGAAAEASSASVVEGLVQERLALMEAEGMAPLAWDTLWAASEDCQLRGDSDAARQWASLAAECARLALGDESDEVARYDARAGHPG